jgi:hypothetical protein
MIESNDIVGFYELEPFFSKKKIIKVINVAGCSRNTLDFARNLSNAHFTEDEIKLLIPYHRTMRCKRLAQLGHQKSEKIMQSSGNPISLICKEIPELIFEEAKKLAKRSYNEKRYLENLRKLVKDERQFKLLQQCYNEFNKTQTTYKMANKGTGLDAINPLSINAIDAVNRGLYSLQDISTERLISLGFLYEKDFFAFLSQENYVIAKELHHCFNPVTGRINIVPFFSDNTVTFVVDHYDLPFLYRLYKKDISMREALREKEISFCLVEAISEIVGIVNGPPVKVYCVRQKNVYWFSKEKYIRKKDSNLRMLIEWDAPNTEFHNKNVKKIVRMLLSRRKQKLVKKSFKV